MSELVTQADTENWEREVLQSSQLVMVDFWAVWCGPCQTVAPVVEELAKEYEGKLKVMKLNTDEAPEYEGKLKVMKLNTDEAPDIAGRYQIMSIPTMLFFKNGEPVEKLVGVRPKPQFKQIIDTVLSQHSATA